jgi:hypothetical protein
MRHVNQEGHPSGPRAAHAVEGVRGKTLLRCYWHEFEAARGGRQIAREIAQMDAVLRVDGLLDPTTRRAPRGGPSFVLTTED